MGLEFFKYNSNGNDFIIIDETKKSFNFSPKKIQTICSRQFCIGADGLVFLQPSDKADFKMKFFNNDGYEANMCGNALLCITKFINDNIVKKERFFIETKSAVYETFSGKGLVSFKADFPKILSENNQLAIDSLNLVFPVIDSGVLHGVIFFDNVDELDVFNLGKKIRFSKNFEPQGINVNFCERITESEIKVRTYERGVEDETFCCSTGALAVAYDVYRNTNINKSLHLYFKGGKITINHEKNGLIISNNPVFAFKGYSNFFDLNTN